MERGRQANRRRAILILMRLLFLRHDRLDHQQMLGPAVRHDLRQVGAFQHLARGEHIARFCFARRGNLCTTLGQLRHQLHCGKALQYPANTGAAHAKGFRQRLFRQFIARQQPVLHYRFHQRIVNVIVFIFSKVGGFGADHHAAPCTVE